MASGEPEPGGVLLVGTPQGLARYAPPLWQTPPTTPEGSASVAVSSIEDRKGRPAGNNGLGGTGAGRSTAGGNPPGAGAIRAATMADTAHNSGGFRFGSGQFHRRPERAACWEQWPRGNRSREEYCWWEPPRGWRDTRRHYGRHRPQLRRVPLR